MVILSLIRFNNLLISFATAVVAVLITKAVSSAFIVVLAGLSVALTAAAGNIINDYYDIEIDRVNRPERPLPSGRITAKPALILYMILNINALVISAYINYESMLIVLLAQTLLFAYSFILKKIALIGNIVIAGLTGMVFLYGGTVSGNMNVVLIPSVFAFLINLSREVLKDIEDIKGDSQLGLKTLPIVTSINFSKGIILTVTVLLILFTLIPYLYEIYNIEYFIIVMSVVNPLLVYFIRGIYITQSIHGLHRFSSILKINMITGLIAIYLGV